MVRLFRRLCEWWFGILASHGLTFPQIVSQRRSEALVARGGWFRHFRLIARPTLTRPPALFIAAPHLVVSSREAGHVLP